MTFLGAYERVGSSGGIGRRLGAPTSSGLPRSTSRLLHSINKTQRSAQPVNSLLVTSSTRSRRQRRQHLLFSHAEISSLEIPEEINEIDHRRRSFQLQHDVHFGWSLTIPSFRLIFYGARSSRRTRKSKRNTSSHGEEVVIVFALIAHASLAFSLTIGREGHPPNTTNIDISCGGEERERGRVIERRCINCCGDWPTPGDDVLKILPIPTFLHMERVL